MDNEKAKERRKGKFNIVDAVIIVVVLLLAAFVVYKLTNKSNYVGDYQEITYTVRVEAMSKVMYDDIINEIPSQLVASGQYVDGEVVSVECLPCQPEYIIDQYDNRIIPSQEYVTVIFTIKARVDMNVLITEVGTQEVRPGRVHIVKTRRFEVNGFIETVTWPDEK